MAARSIESSSTTGNPASTSASGMLGVTMSASGTSASARAETAPSSMRREPLVATITGSTTTLRARCVERRSAMTSMISADETMPTFTAAGGMSSNTASI